MFDPQIERLLGQTRVARLATVDEQGRPHVVPIVFAWSGGVIYTPIDAKPKSTTPRGLRRVRNITSNPHVQVLIDQYSEDWSELGYVQFRGKARLIEEGDGEGSVEHARAVQALEKKYPQYGDLPLAGRPVIAVSIEETVRWGKLR